MWCDGLTKGSGFAVITLGSAFRAPHPTRLRFCGVGADIWRRRGHETGAECGRWAVGGAGNALCHTDDDTPTATHRPPIIDRHFTGRNVALPRPADTDLMSGCGTMAPSP